MTTEIRTIKLDFGTLHREGPSRWRICGRDLTGRYRRVRFAADSTAEAILLAREQLRQPAGRKTEDFPTITIDDALIQAMEERNWTDANRVHEENCCRYFLDWVGAQGLEFWHELRYEHVARYQQQLIADGYAFDTVRLYVRVARRTARWVASNWPDHYRNICERLRQPSSGVGDLSYDAEFGNPGLTIHQVLDFLDWLSRQTARKGFVALLPGVALQGLAGLSILEVLRLTWDRVDLKAGTVTIEGRVKCRQRLRRIPVCRVVRHLLQMACATTGDARSPGRLYAQYKDHRHYSRRLRTALRAWDGTLTLKPKDLRNTIITEAIDGGWYGYYLERYVGHAAKTVSEKHYHANQGKRLEQHYPDKVIAHIEAEIDGWRAAPGSLVLPRPQLAVLVAN